MIGDGFRWLAEPDHFPDGFCSTFVRGLSPEALLNRLRCTPDLTAIMDATDADEIRDDLCARHGDPFVAVIRVGARNEWAFALEEITLHAARPGVLSHLSADTEAASLRRDAAHGVLWFELWRDGRSVEYRTPWQPEDLADFENELGIDAPMLELLSPTSELLTGFVCRDD